MKGLDTHNCGVLEETQADNHEKEGVIKYDLSFLHQPISALVDVAPLDQWRHVLFNLELIGQDPNRYGGLGFGNISNRLPSNAFLISGSQTGHFAYLKQQHCAVVTECDPQINQLKAHGEVKPSSESLTHGVLYNEFSAIGAVVHVHSPLIWSMADQLSLPATGQSIPYGTPEMADAVVAVTNDIEAQSLSPVFVMKGHVDGVVSYGPDLSAAVSSLLDVYHRAVMIPNDC